MCDFFSFVSDGFGNYLYNDWDYRKDHLSESCDSHTHILTRFNIPPNLQDRWHYFEYNPLTKKFINDNNSRKPDIEQSIVDSAENWVNNLDFKTVVPQLIIKSIVSPFDLIKINVATEDDINNLKSWASVRDSVRDSVWASVWASVRDSVGDSVWGSVGDSVWDSVRDSVWAYISTFININYNYKFSIISKLWERGIIPSFDGTIWRLHSGNNVDIIYECSKEDLCADK